MMMMMMKSASDEADEVKMREALLNCSSRNSGSDELTYDNDDDEGY